MRPLEAIVAWNQRRAVGETLAFPTAEEIAPALPLIALTCIDPRLNAHFPEALGLRLEQFIWLRNAGNVITSSHSSTMRSLALACAVKGGHEIVIIGHSDCGVRKTGMAELVDKFRALGVPRERLPDDLVTYFGAFASERQNVMRGVEFARQSAIVGPRVPVHGLMIDVESGRLEWVVNGYETLDRHAPISALVLSEPEPTRPPAPAPPALQVASTKRAPLPLTATLRLPKRPNASRG